MRELSDEALRHESVRRRMLFVVSAVAFSVAMLLTTNQLQRVDAVWAQAAGILLLVIANLVAVFVLFRWMSDPARERARRRRQAVLKALGVPEDDGVVSDGVSSEPENQGLA